MSNDLEYDAVIVLESTRTAQDLDNWNSTRNTCGIKTTDQCAKYPKSMLRLIIAEFNDWARAHHLDASKYPFVRINEYLSRWQVDFHTDRDASGAHIVFCSIIFDTKRRQLCEWQVEL